MFTVTAMRKNIMIGLAVLSLGGTALVSHAQTERHDSAGQTGAGKAGFAEHMAKRQARLHDKLKLTAAQEPAWTAFIASVTPPQGEQKGERPNRADFEKLPAPERLEKSIERQKARLAREESRLGALKTFYGVLTPEQRAIFDKSAPHHGGPGRFGHHGGRGHGGHGDHGDRGDKPDDGAK